MATDSVIDEIVDLAVGHDERVANAARQLTAVAISRLNHVLQYGTPQAQQQLLRAFVPALLRQAESKGQNEEIAQLRAEMQALREDMQGYETPPEDEDPPPDIPTDA